MMHYPKILATLTIVFLAGCEAVPQQPAAQPTPQPATPRGITPGVYTGTISMRVVGTIFASGDPEVVSDETSSPSRTITIIESGATSTFVGEELAEEIGGLTIAATTRSIDIGDGFVVITKNSQLTFRELSLSGISLLELTETAAGGLLYDWTLVLFGDSPSGLLVKFELTAIGILRR